MAYVQLTVVLWFCLMLPACRSCTPGDSTGGGAPAARRSVEPPPPPALFRALAAKGRFVLTESIEDDDEQGQASRPPRRLVLEITPSPPLNTIRVARLRWSLEGAGTPTSLTADNNPENLPLHVALTPSGLFLLDPEAHPADIRRAILGRPDFPAAPRPVAQETRPDGRYVLEARFRAQISYCFGEGPPPEPKQDDCDGVCDGMICFAGSGAVVHLSGTQAPEQGVFSQTGFELPEGATAGAASAPATP